MPGAADGTSHSTSDGERKAVGAPHCPNMHRSPGAGKNPAPKTRILSPPRGEAREGCAEFRV